MMVTRLARFGLAVAAAGSLILFGWLSLRRLVYPLELDCIEGVMMDHIVRLTHGQPIYVQPTLHFIPLAYMPLFSVLSALIAKVFGPALWEPRLVSLVSTWVTAILIGRIVRAETKDAVLGLGAAGVYLMGFGVSGACYDVARPDALMLALALGGLATLRFTTGSWGAFGAAALLALAFFTKQHAAWFVLAALAYLAANQRRRLLPFLLVAGLLCGGGYWLLEQRFGPWFSFYTWEVPARWSQFGFGRVFEYVGHRLFGTFGLLAGASLLALGLVKHPWGGRTGIWTFAGWAAVATGLMATLDPYAYRHTLMPTLVFLSVLGPIALHRIVLENLPLDAPGRPTAVTVVCALLALQFLPLGYPVHAQLPHERAAEAYQTFVSDLKGLPGPMLMPYHGYYEWTAGKGSSLHIIPFDDVMRARNNRLLRQDPHYFDRMFDSLRSGDGRPTIVTDVPLEQSGPLWASLASRYRLTHRLGWLSEALRPVSGNRFTPTFVYEPAPEGAEPPGEPAPPATPGSGRPPEQAPGMSSSTPEGESQPGGGPGAS